MTDMDSTFNLARLLAKATGMSYAVVESKEGFDTIAFSNWLPSFGKIIGIIQPTEKQAG
jgi:hypothetical protein